MNQEQKTNELNNSQDQVQNQLEENTSAAVESADEQSAEEEFFPVLIPDDYDPDEIDYSAQSNMSHVVSVKENVEEAPRYQRPKLKGKEAIDNFFYHHKTTVIVSIVTVVVLAICIIQSIPEKIDYYINIYADVNIGAYSNDEISAQFLEYAEDVDGNGEKAISLNCYNRESTIDPYQYLVAYMMIDTEFGGEYKSFLVVVDQKNYDYLVDLLGEDIFEAYEDYPVLISLKDSELVTSVSESNNNHTELFLALLSIPEDRMDDEELVARHDNAAAMLGRILEAHPELKKADEQ